MSGPGCLFGVEPKSLGGTTTPTCINSGSSLRSSLLPNTIMPAHRHPQAARSHAGRPYKASIIVISSDEEDEHLPVRKRGSRKPKRSRAEGEVLEISEDTSVKSEEPELESLRQRCHELEQVCSFSSQLETPLNKRNLPFPNSLGKHYITERK